MIRQLGVELTRLRWRRAVLLLLVAAVVVPALIAVARIWVTTPPSQADLDSAARANAGEIAHCIERPRQYGVARANAEEGCRDKIVGWYVGNDELSLAGERAGGGLGVVAVLTVLLMLAGTTFAGHDWNTGSMSNQLLFESRRGRVWTAKALAVALAALGLAVVVTVAYWLAIRLTMSLRDLPTADGALTESLAMGLRGAGFAAAAALGGYALTMLLRSTVGTLGVIFGVSVAGGLLMAMLGIGEQWQPQTNASAIVSGGSTYWVEVPEYCYDRFDEDGRAPSAECDAERELSSARGAGYYGVPLLAVVGASVASFRRRDVP